MRYKAFCTEHAHPLTYTCEYRHNYNFYCINGHKLDLTTGKCSEGHVPYRLNFCEKAPHAENEICYNKHSKYLYCRYGHKLIDGKTFCKVGHSCYVK